MISGRITRRELVAGAASAAVAAALPVQGLGRPVDRQAAGGAAMPEQKRNMGSGRAAWMQETKYRWGVMTHYLADWQAHVHNLDMSVELWNKMVDGFDVEGMAKRLESVGAGHYQISIGQNSGYYLSPNAVYDKLVGISPSKCSRRDVVADLYEQVSTRGIKLMVYLPSGAPGEDHVAREALEWEGGPYRNEAFQIKWQQVIEEWSRRWGSKVEGWWFDGCYFPNTMYHSAEPPNFGSFAAAARAGNPNSALAFNPGVFNRLYSQTPHGDYTAGEINAPDQVDVHRGYDGLHDGAQVHILSFLGTKWGMGTPRFTTDEVIAYTKKTFDHGGAVTWDVPVELDGTITQPFLDQLRALGKAFPRTGSGA
jgi:Alpha-L-fucosidase